MSVDPEPSSVDQGSLKREYRLAEFGALRAEILQRMVLQQQVISILMVAAASFYGVGVKDRSVTLLLVFPILAMFLAFSWNSSDLRIGQLGKYIEDKIEKDPGLGDGEGWEHYLEPSGESRGDENIGDESKRIARLSILSGLSLIIATQVIALFLAVVVTLLPVPGPVLPASPGTILDAANQLVANFVSAANITLGDALLFCCDIVVIYWTSRMPKSRKTAASRATLGART